jgi:hypothetical protein
VAGRAGDDGSVTTLHLSTRGLLSKWGFDDGDPFDEVAEWFHDRHGEPVMGHCDCGFFDLGVDDRELLVAVVRRFVLPVLDQRVEVEVIETCHNPIRATSIDGAPVDDEVHYNRLPEPAEITPDSVAVPYEEIVRLAAGLRAAA